ncbi:MAG: ribonuclease HI [Gammaproteobacteria bacterium]|nr:ribonuclease HI [Gammaproteobacteria bacterium]
MARSSSPPASEAVSRSQVLVHADESCLGNQFIGRANPGGAAALVEFWTGDSWRRRDYWTSDPDTTNNRMALSSAIGPLGALARPCRVRFVSDSQYLTRGMTEWLPGWKARGWRRKGPPIKNLELWKELDRAARRHEIEWVWVRGHAGHVRNEYANHLAVRAAGKLDRSGGFAASRFDEWLAGERAEAGRYLDFDEHAAPRPFG